MSGNNSNPNTPSTASNPVREPDWYKKRAGEETVPSTPSKGNQSAKSSSDRDAPTAASEARKHNHMLETVVQLGNDLYTIKAYFQCGKKHLFALECQRTFTGYNGICPSCHEEHIRLAPLRGYYASTDSIYEAVEKQKLEKERLKGPKKIQKLLKIEKNLPPLNHEITGINKGIQGDSNSCYMDATIFCMFAYSHVFDSLLHMDVQKEESLAKLQQLLRENIVNILRSDEGFVERDALFHLRVLLSEATGDQSFKEVEKDPSEFLRALENRFHYAPLKTILPDQPPNENGTNMTTNIIWEMFDANPDKSRSTSIASIFRNSLAEISVKLATIPPFLVLVAPRHTRSQRSYRYIIPDRQITLDHKIVQLVCLRCNKTNHNSDQQNDFFFCNECYSKEPPSSSPPSTNANITCYCLRCLTELHKETPEHKRFEHIPTKIKDITKLKLFAVLCIEIAHYVAFVKCHKPNQEHEWLFFDSMSDRIHNEKNVPCVSRVPDFNKWIQEAEDDKYYFEDLDQRRNEGRPTSQAFPEAEMRRLRLFRDGAFFFYENSEASYQ